MPSWKTQTTSPNITLRLNVFRTMAFSGTRIDPNISEQEHEGRHDDDRAHEWDPGEDRIVGVHELRGRSANADVVETVSRRPTERSDVGDHRLGLRGDGLASGDDRQPGDVAAAGRSSREVVKLHVGGGDPRPLGEASSDESTRSDPAHRRD